MIQKFWGTLGSCPLRWGVADPWIHTAPHVIISNFVALHQTVSSQLGAPNFLVTLEPRSLGIERG